MRLHLIGIGGTGMGALAGLLKAKGHDVRGSDGPIYPPMCDQLAAMEIPVFEGYSPDNLDWDPELVVVGNTCKRDHVEVAAAVERGFELRSMPQLIEELLLPGKSPIVIGGTHGKTTTSSLMAHILVSANRDPSVFVGGVPLNLGRGFRLGEGPDFVLEGDEYDSAFFDKQSKFLRYHPTTAVLTSVELDHVDIFSSMEEVRATFRKFAESVPEEGLLLVAANNPEALAIAEAASCTVRRYGVEGDQGVGEDCEWLVRGDEVLDSGRCRFEVLHFGESLGVFESILSGKHNLQNLCACIAVANSRGLSPDEIREAVATFSGVTRRQEFKGLAQGVTVLDDYGHHPTAVSLTLEGLHKRYPGRRLIALYEPRTATSRRKTFQREYVDAFALADALVVGELYSPDSIPKEERFDPERLALEVHQGGTPATHIADVDKIVAHVVDIVRPGDVVVVFSSGAFGGIHGKLLAALGDAITPAHRDHLESIKGLLHRLDLQYSDLDEDSIRNFYALVNEAGLVGCVGLEVFGEDAVLRSLAVTPNARGVGYGWMLADLVISQALFRGVRRLYLVTESASDFFAAKHGFRKVVMSTVPERVAASSTFQDTRENMVPMRLDL